MDWGPWTMGHSSWLKEKATLTQKIVKQIEIATRNNPISCNSFCSFTILS